MNRPKYRPILRGCKSGEALGGRAPNRAGQDENDCQDRHPVFFQETEYPGLPGGVHQYA